MRTKARTASSPPGVLHLVGHPVRWRLLGELARSDRRVGELTHQMGERQSLVSYHLGRLRSEGVVTAHRSANDGRDVYYGVDLARCAELLSGAGAALHPGLRLERPADPPIVGPPSPRVLFVCTGNSGRSPMAEALTSHLSRGSVVTASAGSRPKPLHPNAIRVMHERGIDITGHPPTHLDELEGGHFDHVVTLCDRVREVCPEFGGGHEPIHWSIPDPAVSGSTDRASYPTFQHVADELTTRIEFLLARLSHEHHTDKEPSDA